MVKHIGLYNVEFVGFVYSNNEKFHFVRICEFDKKERCIDDKYFYISGNKIPDIETEEDVRKIMEFPSRSKIII